MENALQRKKEDAHALIDGVAEMDSDAEKAFCRILPAGAPDNGENPGKIYLALRKMEDPENRRKECEFIYHLSRPMLDGLSRDMMSFFMELRVKSFNVDKDPRVRRERMAAVAQAMDVPRSLSGVLSTMDAALRNRNILGLRRALVALRKLERDWPSIRRKVTQAPMTPVDAWCARLSSVRDLLATLRRVS